MKKILFLLSLLFFCSRGTTQGLITIDQDFNKALSLAAQEDKMVFIDFYTTWCAPCKKLENLVFQNDSIKNILKKDFILLKYNAEDDSVYNLSKKHHISSYPTGLILNKRGYVVNRSYGFSGENFQSLSTSVIEFTKESSALNAKNKIIKGYSNTIDITKYPQFYIDYINRTNTKIQASVVNEYWRSQKDVLSEEYFSTLLYFANEAVDPIAEDALANKANYIELYGTTDVETLMYFLTSGKFKRAISEKDQQKFDEAVHFARKALSEEWINDVVSSFERKFLIAQDKWEQVFTLYENQKKEGKLSNGAINHFCWDIYKKCNDPQVIDKCLIWMKQVTEEESFYAYLDTYAFLLYKSGDKTETKRIAQLAIEAAKKENESTKNLEALLKKL